MQKVDMNMLEGNDDLQAALGDFDAQLADKASKAEVLTIVGDISDGTPLFAPNTAGMTDTTRNYVNTTDGLLYTHNGTAWVSTGVTYQATGIANGAVTPSKTDFATTVLGTANIFNKDMAFTNGFSVSIADGTLYVKADFSASEFIPVKANQSYISAKYDRVAEFDANKVFIKATTAKTFTTAANTAFIRVGIANANISTEMIVEGNTLPTTYQPYDPRVQIPKLVLDEPTVKGILFTGDVLKDSLKVDEKNVDFVYRDSVNLFNKDTVTPDKRLSTTNATVNDTNNTISDFIEVEPSTAYSVTEGSYTHFFDANKQFISGHGLGITTFTTPTSSKYVKITVRKVKLPTFMMVLGSVVPLESDYVAYNLYSFTDNILVAKEEKPFEGQVLHAMGDSITGGLPSYLTIFKRELGFATTNDYGIGGTAIAVRPAPWDTNAMSVRYTAMTDNADVVTVLGGTNDFGSSQVNLGTMSDRGTDTFYGACHTLFGGLVTKYPTKKIAAFTMPPRYNMHLNNSKGYTVFQFADAILEVCAYYAIPCLDILRHSQLRPYNQTNKETYFDGADGLHPNEAGYELMAKSMVEFMKTI